MCGTLYICGTPIGNLEDISFRTVRILGEADLIAAEDTRNTRKLLSHYNIKTPMTSYHKFNEKEKGEELIRSLKEGKNIALVSDAGMPGISDPGFLLIKLCYENKIKVTAVPGPTASVTGLVLSGIDTSRYIFEGFLPIDKRERKKILDSFIDEERTIILYEAPHRLLKTLEELSKVLGERQVSVIREITKHFEEVVKDTSNNLIEIFKIKEPRGEIVLVLEGESKERLLKKDKEKWESLSILEHMEIYKELPKKEAMKMVAKDRGVSKREIYKSLL